MTVAERVLVIIPTYNEAENAPRIARAALAEDERIDLLFVDDGSPDGTAAFVRALASEPALRRGGEPRIHLLERSTKDGLGRAYVAGFRWGMERGYPILIQMDADLSHPPSALPRMIEALQEIDVAIGSRYVGGRVNVINWPISRLLISLFGSLYARKVTGLPVRDATGGFNAYRRHVLEAIDIDRVESNGYSFQIELKFRAYRKGFQLRELPIVFTERETGDSKMSKRIVREAVWRVWKLRWLALIGRL